VCLLALDKAAGGCLQEADAADGKEVLPPNANPPPVFLKDGRGPVDLLGAKFLQKRDHSRAEKDLRDH
jgi:hypothetical protein